MAVILGPDPPTLDTDPPFSENYWGHSQCCSITLVLKSKFVPMQFPQRAISGLLMWDFISRWMQKTAPTEWTLRVTENTHPRHVLARDPTCAASHTIHTLGPSHLHDPPQCNPLTNALFNVLCPPSLVCIFLLCSLPVTHRVGRLAPGNMGTHFHLQT